MTGIGNNYKMSSVHFSIDQCLLVKDDVVCRVPTSSWKTWKITKKSSMQGKIMEFEKKLNNHGKIM